MPSRFVATLAAWLFLVVVMLLLAGCATTAPAQPAPPVLVAVPCPTAVNPPAEPAERLDLIGYDVRPYIENRQAWIAHSRDLRTRLEACK